MDNVWLEFVIIVLGILANGFFACSEIALVSARPSRLAQLRDAGRRGAAVALRLKENPETFLAAIQIAITVVGTLASAVGGAAAVDVLTPALLAAGYPAAWARTAALAAVIAALTYVSLVIGELAPKAIALRNPEAVAAAVARPLAAFSRASGWLVRVLTVSTRAVLRVVGVTPGQESPFVSEEEVRYLVRQGAAQGVFEKAEEQLVHNVFEFGDITVREIMVPRVSIQGLDLALPPTEVLAQAAAIGHSRIPVYRDSIEHPVGVVLIKDLLTLCAAGQPPRLDELIVPPLFVPETARISVLLREFQRARQQMAFVVDEYGSIVGLVTIEDVVEEIVGDIREEREASAPYMRRLPDGSYLLEGTAPVRELSQALNLDMPESTNYTTIAGLIIDHLGAIPKPGAAVTGKGYRLTVVEVDGPRIALVKLERHR